ncbi:MAG: glycosyltransferase family 4 protein [Planctomycetota bacterium]
MADQHALTDRPDAEPLRVRLVQPALAKYRLPVFAELASRDGIDLHVAYTHDGKVPSLEPSGFEGSFHRSRRGAGVSFSGFQLAQACRKKADVIVLPWTTRETMLVPSMLRARAAGVGVVLWGHGYSKNEAGWRRKIRNTITGLAHTIVLYNRSAADRLIDEGLDASRVFVAPNALDQTPIQATRDACLADGATLEAFQREHGFVRDDGSKRPGLLFVSRLERDNRVDRLLDATAMLGDEGLDPRVVVVGKGEALDELKAQADRLGIADHCSFTGAVYGEAELAPWFCSCDLFCYPENIGLSILHAMGYGLPIVTSDRRAAQNPEIETLEHELNGLVYEHGSNRALADALGRLLRDEAFRARLGAEAHRTATEVFSLPRMVDGLEASIMAAGRLARTNRG